MRRNPLRRQSSQSRQITSAELWASDGCLLKHANSTQPPGRRMNTNVRVVCICTVPLRVDAIRLNRSAWSAIVSKPRLEVSINGSN